MDSCFLVAIRFGDLIFRLNHFQPLAFLKSTINYLYSQPTESCHRLPLEGVGEGLCCMVRDQMFVLDPSERRNQCPVPLCQPWRSSKAKRPGSQQDAREDPEWCHGVIFQLFWLIAFSVDKRYPRYLLVLFPPPELALVVGRISLIIILASALGAAWVVEQPSGSMLEFYPTFRRAITRLMATCGIQAAKCSVWSTCSTSIRS